MPEDTSGREPVTPSVEAAPYDPSDNGEHEEGGPSEETATFVEHLDELRTRLIRCIVYILVLAGLSFSVLNQLIIDVLLSPVQDIVKADPGGGLISTAPAEWIFIWVKILLISGVFLAGPLILGEVYGFVAPALTRSEKRYARWAFLFAPLLFAAGLAFAYIIIPFGLRFLYHFTTQSGIRWLLSVEKYLGFFLTLSLGLGLVFQMPLVVAVLTKIGIVTPQFLSSKRRYAVVVLAIIAAIITPTPDIVNLSIVMVPMLVLFEVSILVARCVGREESEPRPMKRLRRKPKRAKTKRARDKGGEPTQGPPPPTADN